MLFPFNINVKNNYVVDIDECSSSPCENGGTCSTPQLNMFSCKCAAGYTGTNCESGKCCLFLGFYILNIINSTVWASRSIKAHNATN